MSDEATRKFRDAALLASKFFRDLADIFDEKNGTKRLVSSQNSLNVTESRPAQAAVMASQITANGNAAPANTATAETKTKKTKKQLKKENAPQIKRPLSAYMLFNNNRRPVLRQEYPTSTLP